ncbi:MAG TPA: hypothetical protein VF765_24460 [Polyangiaceae bacterium]
MKPTTQPTIPPDQKRLLDDGYHLAAALAARGRTTHVFDVADFFGIAGRPIHQLAMQILRIGEETEATDAALKTRAEQAKRAGAGEEQARADAEALEKERTLEAIFRACRRVDEKGQATAWAAFPGVAWLRDNLTTDQTVTLLNLYDELKRRRGPVKMEIDDEHVEAIAGHLADHAGDDIPEAYLAPYPRWFLTHLIVLVAIKLAAARRSVEVLLQEREAWAVERTALETSLAAARGERVPESDQDEEP